VRTLGGFFLICLLCAPMGSRAQTPPIADILAEADKARVQSHWEEATAAYQRARDLAAKTGDAKSDSIALSGLAAVEYGKTNFEAADKLARQALAIGEKENDPRAISAALIQIGNVQYRRGEFQASRDMMLRALDIRREMGDHSGIGIALNNLANASRQLGDRLQSIDYLVEAEKEFALVGTERNRAVVLNNIGIAYGNLGDYERGLEYSWKSQAMAEKLGDDSRLANAYNNIGVIETNRGNYRTALIIFQKAIEADQRAQLNWEMAEATNNIGLVYQAQRDHEQAIACYRKTLEINRTVGDKSIEADAHHNLGTQLLALGKMDEAVAQLRQSLEISKAISYPSMEASSHNGLGMAFVRMNRLTEAVAELKEAARLQKETSDTPAQAGTLTDLAYVALQAGKAEEALAQAKEAAAMLDSVERPETLWEAQLISGQALRRLHRDEEAARQFEASIATIESLRARVAGPPTALPLYFSDKLQPYQERVEIALAAGKTEEALRFAEQSKSRALGDLLRSGRVSLDKSLTAEERDSERRLESRLVELNLKVAKEHEAAQAKAEREKTRRDLDALQSRLYAAHPETAFERGVRPPMTPAELAQLVAGTGAVVLEYFVTPRNSYVFVLKAGASVRVAALGIGEAALKSKTAEFHRQIAEHDLGYAAGSQELYRLLVAPAQKELAGQAAVIVVPDGPLWDVPFHALAPAPKRFLIEETAVSYVPSLAVLAETVRMARTRSATPATRELLALGNPGAAGLPEAEHQVREIEKLYGGQSKILTGESATEGALKQEAGQYRVLHLASHAILDDVNPMYSYAQLVKSGSDDGILEARELMQLNLKAEVLVLSACETARGRAAPGEGINGMLWAAFVAGAPTTVASLWRVESASTSELMIGFHRHWLAARGGKGGVAKAASLRAAARELIAGGKYAHPFYWAGFVVVGSPN
jgi:CHAT domain-containing protein/Tfp pilus assembly protein PilF